MVEKGRDVLHTSCAIMTPGHLGVHAVTQGKQLSAAGPGCRRSRRLPGRMGWSSAWSRMSIPLISAAGMG